MPSFYRSRCFTTIVDVIFHCSVTQQRSGRDETREETGIEKVLKMTLRQRSIATPETVRSRV